MTTLMIQTDRILDNFHLIQKKVGKTAVIPDLSGNAFGLGDLTVASLLANEGVSLFAVSRLDEARRLAESVRGVDILMMTPYSAEEEAAQIVEQNLIATVASADSAVVLSGVAAKLKRRARIHLKFDTGSDTCGFLPEEASKAAATVQSLSNLDVVGTYTSIKSGASQKAAQAQLSVFAGILNTLRREDLGAGLTHMAGAIEAIRHPFVRLDAVHAGSELTGRLPCRDKWGFKKVGRLVSEICDIRWIAAKHALGKAARYKTRKASKIALVPVGLADGLFLSERRSVLVPQKLFCEINTRRIPVVSRPEYTHTLLDVTDADCSVGDMVSFDVVPGVISPAFRRDYV